MSRQRNFRIMYRYTFQEERKERNIRFKITRNPYYNYTFTFLLVVSSADSDAASDSLLSQELDLPSNLQLILSDFLGKYLYYFSFISLIKEDEKFDFQSLVNFATLAVERLKEACSDEELNSIISIGKVGTLHDFKMQ